MENTKSSPEQGCQFNAIVSPHLTGIVTNTYCGLQFIPSLAMRDPIYEKRTWKERLFSLPWKPFLKVKLVGYKLWDKTEMIDKIKKQFAG